MGYYDYDDEEAYYGYEERIEPVSLVAEACTEKDIANVLMDAGLIQDKNPRLVCSMEKLIFVHGNPNEVYSSAEIRFTERIDKVIVFSDFFKNMNRGSMACRVIAARLNCSGNDALKTCVSFEKITNKALDGCPYIPDCPGKYHCFVIAAPELIPGDLLVNIDCKLCHSKIPVYAKCTGTAIKKTK